MCKQDDSAPQITQSSSEDSSSVSSSPVGKSAANNGKGVPGTDDFHWSYTEEPHASRRKMILAKYPQIKELYGYDPNMRYVCFFLVSLQVFLAYFMRERPWWQFVLVAYVVGGTANHQLLLANHELSHNLGFKRMVHNKLFSFFCNLPIGVPSAISFKRYHMEHHKYQGEQDVDVDLPTPMEGRIFNNMILKFWFVIFQIAFYAIRPLVVSPKKPGLWELGNAVCCISFDIAIYMTLGPFALFYLFLSTFLGTGLHPCAAHFIAEHYVFVEGAETYSYYGWLNIFAFNVGYHNEHHDFPAVPGSRLPQLRAIASEFYDDLPQHKSWPKVHWDFITNPNITCFSRVKRHTLTNDDIADIRSR